jgi:hypothetical protein
MQKLCGAALATLLSLVASSAAQASYVIDNFTTVTGTLSQNGVGTSTSSSISGAGILGSRTISLTVASPLTSASASAGLSPGLATAGFSGNYSSPNLASNFTLSETFASTNAILDGDTSLSFLIGSTLGTTMTITANGTSTYTFTDPVSALGINHSIAFSSFSDPTVFSHLTSLTFTETFPNPGLSAPSVSFSGPILLSNPNAVPEPATVLMIAQVGIAGGLFGLRRRFTRRNQAVA